MPPPSYMRFILLFIGLFVYPCIATVKKIPLCLDIWQGKSPSYDLQNFLDYYWPFALLSGFQGQYTYFLQSGKIDYKNSLDANTHK